jgi:hypothetical protein
MKFGVREICDVVLKAKAPQKIGNKIFYAGEPVLYFDTLKTSSMESAATTVYAQGGRGNARLVAWEGERTVTFTMEDALISPEGFMILSGAGLIESSASKPIFQHVTETIDGSKIDKTNFTIRLSKKPYLPTPGEDKIGIEGNYAYVMLVKDGEIISEPYIPEHEDLKEQIDEVTKEVYYNLVVKDHPLYDTVENPDDEYQIDAEFARPFAFDSVIVDYYVKHEDGNAMQIEITADKFGGNYYLEASTLFRDQRGVDMPAEFIIPNCKIQSNFTFTMASSGDPSTFTFTMDAFPDYTRFDKSKKVLAAIQIIQDASSQELFRTSTVHSAEDEKLFG